MEIRLTAAEVAMIVKERFPEATDVKFWEDYSDGSGRGEPNWDYAEVTMPLAIRVLAEELR